MENARVGIKRVTGRIFIQDPFNPICFSEDSEKHIEVRALFVSRRPTSRCFGT